MAAAVYVLAWLVGLFAAPARPTAGADAVKGYLVDHSGAAVAQSLLVHGVAGVALAAFAWSLSRSVDHSSVAVVVLGSVAAVLSLLQAVILLSVATGVSSLPASAVDQRVGWIDTVDTLKLAVLAAFVVVASVALVTAGSAGEWLRLLAVALAVLLVAGGTSFMVSSSVLTGALYLSLPLLLIWVGVVAGTVTRKVPDRAVAVVDVTD